MNSPLLFKNLLFRKILSKKAILFKGGKRITLFLIGIYRQISLFTLPRCIYIPTCSEYTQQAFLRYPFLKAIRLSCLRILRCHPFARGGFDPLR